MNPGWDFHAIAPIIIVSATIVVVLIADFFFEYRGRFQTQQIASFGVLAAMIPVITLAVDGTTRSMFGGGFVVDPYSLVFQGFFLAAAYVVDAAVGRLHRRRRLLPGRVLRPAAHVAARHDGHGERTGPRVDLRGARDDLDPHVRPRRLAQARPEVERGGDQVLPDRRAVVRGDALRHVARVRAHRLDAADRHRGQGRSPRLAAAARGRLPHHRRVRVQGERGAVPLLGARHLRGCAHAGDRVPLGRRRRPAGSSPCCRS